MKNVLVTGANGHVGYTLVSRLKEAGYQVRASVRDASDPARTEPLRALGAEVAEADILRPETLAPPRWSRVHHWTQVQFESPHLSTN